ncbi:MAG: hypothetical protein AB1352_02605 [Patescibacteria group bacterium]
MQTSREFFRPEKFPKLPRRDIPAPGGMHELDRIEEELKNIDPNMGEKEVRYFSLFGSEVPARDRRWFMGSEVYMKKHGGHLPSPEFYEKFREWLIEIIKAVGGEYKGLDALFAHQFEYLNDERGTCVEFLHNKDSSPADYIRSNIIHDKEADKFYYELNKIFASILTQLESQKINQISIINKQ